MDRKTYIETVLSALRHVTRREREAIRAEIDGHIEDHMADLLELDYPPELAEERTLSAMGDPAEVGRELNEQYTGWGGVILSRVLLAALVAVCAVVLCSNPSLYGLRQNLEARKPLEWRLEEMGPGGQILDMIEDSMPANHSLDFLFTLAKHLRFLIILALLALVFSLLYKWMPAKNLKYRRQLPGAVFSAVVWAAFSFIFSFYVSLSDKFGAYGYIGTIMVAMIWIFYCFYFLLMGGFINHYIEMKRAGPEK